MVRAKRFVHAFAVQKSMIEHRHHCVCFVGDFPIYVDRRRHKLSVLPMLDSAQMRVLNAAQMRDADRQTIDEIGIPSMVLMENAGRQVVAALEAGYEDLTDRHVAVLCGPGNNGGDGFVVARTLYQRGVEVSVFVIGSMTAIKGDARLNVEILGRLGLTVVEIADEQAWELHFSEISKCDLIVDAVFGTGLKAPLAGMLETVAAD